MAENARPPVAVRIVRPYDTEEEFLESELETVGKTSVILIGAHARPQGVILRFEVTLANGSVVLRGEGRVLQHKESAFRGQPGLALRFTRLDPKSKALVDRASAIREARLSGSMPPQPVPLPPESNPVSSIAMPESSSSPISVPDPEPTPPPLPRPVLESRPPTKPPPPDTRSELPNPLVAVPSFAPMALPSSLPSGGPSSPAPPAPPNATVAPDAMLAHILTAATPPPPAPAPLKSDRPTSPPDMLETHAHEEAKTRPGKIPQLLEESSEPASQPAEAAEPIEPVEPVAAKPDGANVHATTTVAAPPIREPDALPPPLPPLPPPAPPPVAVPVVKPAPRSASLPSDTAVTRVADRDALLARLRERRASMPEDKKDDILASRDKPR